MALIAVAAACAVALAVAATPASASEVREYDSQITGFSFPFGITVGPEDSVWVSDVGHGSVISEYSAYPSQSKIGAQTGGGLWGGQSPIHGLAVSDANEFLYTGPSGSEGACGRGFFYIFDNSGQLYRTKEPPGFICQSWVAVDNSPEIDSRGHYYFYAHGENSVEAFDGYGNPVNFSGSASYISGNRITGTPSGNFSSESAGSFSPVFSGITVDSHGNIWVVDQGKAEIDEFSSSGLFLRRITGSGVPPSNTPAGPQGFGTGFPGLGAIAVDPTTGDVLVSDRSALAIDEFSPTGEYIGRLTGTETPAGSFGYECYSPYGTEFCYDNVDGLAVDSQGHLYVTDGKNGVVDIFKPRPTEPKVEYQPETNPTPTSGTLNATIDPDGGGPVTSCHFEYGTSTEYSLGQAPCTPDPSGSPFTTPTEVHAEISGLTTETTYHYRVVAGNANTSRKGVDQTYTPHHVVGLRAEAVTNLADDSATLNGSFVGNGSDTHYYFEWGKTVSYGNTTPASPEDAGSPSGPARTTVSADIGELVPATRYHYRVVAENGSVSRSDDRSFVTPARLPEVREGISNIHSNSALFKAEVNPGGTDTSVNFEIGPSDCSEMPDPCSLAFADGLHVGANLSFDTGSERKEGLEGGTTYHYRIVATNSSGSTYGPDRTFATYPAPEELNDPCPNALARQQTGSALVTDCRAYELVSAASAGGYDVESNLVPGQTPFAGYPEADGAHPKVLYGIHNGAIPGVPGNPTNRGVDPYVAERGSDGWTTSYVGIPANDPYASAPFSSTLVEADAKLDTFAFGGPEICSPCFEDGSSGTPLRLPDGSLVQGMQGSEAQPGATADGLVEKHLSTDGSHFIFSTTSKLEPDGSSNGDVSIYDRNLRTGTTQVVSKSPAGANLPCLQGAGECHAPGDANGIAELDVSADGSRVLIGQKVSSDADGNVYYHLYMHVGTNPDTVDLTPGTTSGVLFDGMTADGTKVFYTTVDRLVAGDTDNEADIYEAEVGEGGTITPKLISVKSSGPSNDESCNPPGSPVSWNAVAGNGKCSAVALAGGAGLASESGTFYFLSPELLDRAAEAEGEKNQANLYVVQPGDSPKFVATIDTSTGKPGPPAPLHPRVPGSFVSGLEHPESLAVDQTTGDVYVAQRSSASVARFTAAGAPDNFTEGPDAGTNELTGQSLGGGGEGEIAVDSAPTSPLKGALYVTSNGESVSVYSKTGKPLGEITGFSEACGVAVDQSNGAVYVGDFSNDAVYRFQPISAAEPVTNADYEKTGITTENVFPCPVGTDSAGHVFAMSYGGSKLLEYSTSQFDPSIPEAEGTPVGVTPANTVYSDPANHDVYVDTGSKIVVLNSGRKVVGQFASGEISSSQGVAVNGTTKHAYVSTGSEIIEFGSEPAPYEPIENPTVLHGTRQAGIHDTSDFQVTPSGSYAVFPTTQPLDANYANEGHTEIYRYDAASGALECASCAPTGAPAAGDASLATNGLSLTDDGRVFFDSTDALVLRDDDNRKDVYEWEKQGSGNCEPPNPTLFPTGICLSLISAGTSPFDSSLLSVSADGTDAYFFTHDTLAHGDDNGPVAKIYDARSDGGFFHIPPPALCAASDECHGPGTKEAGPPAIRTIAGSPGDLSTMSGARCKEGFVRKHGKCVPRHHKTHHKHRRHHRRKHRKATHRSR